MNIGDATPLDERIMKALQDAYDAVEEGEPWVITRHRFGLAVMGVVDAVFWDYPGKWNP